MKAEHNRNKSCKNKFPFSTRQAAMKVAKKFNQNTYCCPVCFCWHNTSCDKWQDEYVHIDKYNNLLKNYESLVGSKNVGKKQRYIDMIYKQGKKLREYKRKIKELNRAICNQPQI